MFNSFLRDRFLARFAQEARVAALCKMNARRRDARVLLLYSARGGKCANRLQIARRIMRPEIAAPRGWRRWWCAARTRHVTPLYQ